MTTNSAKPKRHSKSRSSSRRRNEKQSGLNKCLIIGLILIILLLFCACVGVFFLAKSMYNKEIDPKLLKPCPDPFAEFYEDQMPADGEGDTKQFSAEELRLPGDLVPKSYNWTVRTYLPYGNLWYDPEKNFTIEGEVIIEFQCLEPTKVITLNQNTLNISEASFEIWHSDEEMLEYYYLINMEMDNDREMVHFYLNGTLTKDNNYTILMTYTGPISDKVLKGIYRSTYVGIDGQVRYMAATQMQPTDARRALPCFDEPAMKATFTVTVFHPVGTVALSNARENASYAIGGNWMITDYIPSPKMSSYLLALCICDFVYTERTVRGVRFRIWAREEVKDQTSYAADVGPKILGYYEDYFGTKFPLEKIDMIALPDFAAGAMENWGLITYREKYLLYDPTVYTLQNKQLVAVVIAHELAHMWFGNLVTMTWWDDLWLNEGFATFVEFIGAHYADPGFEMQKQFVSDAVLGSMELDQLASSHPLYVPVETVNSIQEAFDSISYEKGGSIIRMIEYVLGTPTFKRSIQRYLRDFKYGNANNTELWNTLTYIGEAASAHNGWDGELMNVTEFARSWTVQMGFPLLIVERKIGNLVTVTQKRFKLDENAVEKEKYQDPEYGYEWYIPVWYRTADLPDTLKFAWNTPEDPEKKELTSLEWDSWILVNPDARTYMRIEYDQRNYDLLSKALKTNYPPFSVESRCQMLDDAFTLAQANRINYTTALQMTEYLSYEDNYLVWSIAMRKLSQIGTLMRYTPAYGYIREYLVSLLKDKYYLESWKLDPPKGTLEEKMEGFVVGQMCSLDFEPCYTRAMDEFRKLILAKCGAEEPLSTSCNILRPIFRHVSFV